MDENAERIFVLERDHYSTRAAAPLDVHVLALARVDDKNLPPAESIFER